VADIRQQVEAMIFPVQHGSSLEKPAQLEGQGVEVTLRDQVRADSQPEPQAGTQIEKAHSGAEAAAQPVAPSCHQCGEVMVLRKARSGRHAGQQFWGCSAFPKCRGAMKC